MLKYKRVSLKLSGEAMGYDEHTEKAKVGAIDFDKVERIASQIKALHALGVQAGVTLGGGNMWRGRTSGEMDRNRADQMGMLATVINSLAVQDALCAQGVPCVVMSMVDVPRAAESYTSRHALEALDAGKVVIFAGGSGSPFFSTDTAAALKACEIHADALLLAKNIDYVYSADPRIDPNAVPYKHLSYAEVIDKQLHATDLTAITLCRENRIPIIAFAMAQEENVVRAVKGEAVGTRIDDKAD